jgi:N-acetylmuramoyl-L-alanine amidase
LYLGNSPAAAAFIIKVNDGDHLSPNFMGGTMPANALLQQLVDSYRDKAIQFPQLRAVSLAQWMLESGRATSDLAAQYYNFAGLKWRPEMAPYATKVTYTAHDGTDDYCWFATVDKFIEGYWAFLDRAPYAGWKNHVSSAADFIRFIGPIYTPSAGYADNVLSLVAEAKGLLGAAPAAGTPAAPAHAGTINLGTVVLDPGHGGTVKVGGSSPNNATSASGVLEKTLTLEFCTILRDELVKLAAANGETINVVLTRTSDVNLGLADRAHVARDRNAKLFLCLHFNGMDDRSIQGCETYYRSPDRNLNLDDDVAFATSVHQAMYAGLKAIHPGAKDRQVKPDTESGPGGMSVLDDDALGNRGREKSKMCRSAYIEFEFISNPTIDTLLVSGPQAIADRTAVLAEIAKAMRLYLKSMS